MGQPADLHNAQLVIGQEVDTSLSTKGTDLRVERVVVTNENVLGNVFATCTLKNAMTLLSRA
ncbi:putative transport protein YidE [Escherichia coli]|uniref:Putative transport protein YidE n=1 Tax=Escherichia coli TaxID=562 RepID=A0A377AJD9_ECOLX|nr:putative transport protein YidE [Escherichia coli]